MLVPVGLDFPLAIRGDEEPALVVIITGFPSAPPLWPAPPGVTCVDADEPKPFPLPKKEFDEFEPRNPGEPKFRGGSVDDADEESGCCAGGAGEGAGDCFRVGGRKCRPVDERLKWD